MANKDFQQFFASYFSGIDGQHSALEPESTYVNRAVNLEMSVGDSIRGRVGCQTAGSHGFFAIFPYRYTRTQDQYDIVYQTAAGVYPNQTTSITTTKTVADGATLQKVIALNGQAWVLDLMNITITQTNAAAYTWFSYVNGSNINFKILKDGVSISDTSLGDGISSSTSIYSLLGTIDALADLAVSRTTRGTCPPYAIVNGNQNAAAVGSTAYGGTWSVNVSAHNFSAGDIITFPSASFAHSTLVPTLSAGLVIATTATVITYVGSQVRTLLNNDVLGYMGQPATSFPISTISSESSGIMTISFPYWRLMPEGDFAFGSIFNAPFNTWYIRTNPTSFGISSTFYAPAVSVNDSGNLYITASDQISIFGTDSYSNNLIRLDSLQLTRAGLPTPTMTVADAGAGAVGAGTYKYKSFLRRYDAQGNIWDGPVSAVISITQAVNRFTIVTVTPPLYSNATGFQGRSCYKHTTEAPASGSSFYVDDSTGGVGNTAFIQPGDVICLTDNTTQKVGLFTDVGLATVLGTLHRTRCTDYTAQTAVISPTISSIKVADSSGYQINTNTPISTGLTVVVLRTAAGGNQYYKLAEFPCNGFAAYPFYDNVTDAVLTAGEQYIEVEIGKEHNAPPPCTLVCQHQGGLVVARGPTSPNTVAVSTADGIEYFPTASNSFDVPSTQAGSIIAIASDSDDRLAVLKERAYYDVVGSVDEGNFAVSIRNEGDYGIVSQASLVRTPLGLTGLSKNGFVVIKDGDLNPWAFEEVNARIINQASQFAWATAFNDSTNRQYVCTIPQVSGEPVSFVIDYSRRDDTDAQQLRTKVFERSYTTKIDQAGGGALIDETLYHLSATSPYGVFRRLRRFNGDSPSGNGNGDSFIDNTNAISYILESPPISRGTPGLLKSPIRVRVWSIPNDYVVEGWVPFSMLVETGASPLAQYIGGSSPLATSSTITFSASTDLLKDVKLVKSRAHFYMIRFTTNTIRTAPFLTGYEMMFAENYDKEDFQK